MAQQIYPLNVGVLGATGTVGQRFLVLLASHPYLRVHAIGASPRSVGLAYPKAVKWKQTTPIPKAYRDLNVSACEPGAFAGCKIIFSGLDADVAGDIELAFRDAGFAVFSNAKNYRRAPLDHLAVVRQQQQELKKPGFIVTNANCSTTGLVVPLAALERAFGPIDTVLVTTLQAISGAGYPGVPSLDIMDNVVPFIGGEEEKMVWETKKILGSLADTSTGFALRDEMRVSATCTRVPVIDGHTECVSVRFARRRAPDIAAVRAALSAYTCDTQTLGCPSAPTQAIEVHDAEDRPQPRLDRESQAGAAVSVGHFVLLVNNVCLGAATRASSTPRSPAHRDSLLSASGGE
ncbi:aspartate-semialdehyde dehydrogenase [Exidia glandulosa HHB12029]|uniref:Aspartate-semialdehyde dehydrogenase n=1 Tax=Exidia glandulosa HHB12029 TaxID=1314781 RepID=A0A166AR80_EXIGL|nr:aspartate-semialdehyde dehydrogenase [Exidia glandulosa HHB12029]